MSNSPRTPAIPPLSNIQDPETKRALEALINGWRIRNGETQPDSDERFVRKGELQALTEQATIKYFSTGAGAAALSTALSNTTNSPLNEYIRSTVDEVARQVVASPPFRRTGQALTMVEQPQIFSRLSAVETVVRNEVNRLETVDNATVETLTAIGARVGTAETGLTTEQSTRTNSDNALGRAVNTLWATIGNTNSLVQTGSTVTNNAYAGAATNWTQVQAAIRDPFTQQLISTAAVRDEARAEADAITDRLTAERTIKVDVNGYVAGIGVIANADMTSGATTSEIVMRADRFSVGSASGPGITPIVPFVVTTTPTTVNGRTVPAGVFINNAVISNGAIGTAQIGVAQVDTLTIAGNSVTLPIVSGSDSYQEVVTSATETGTTVNGLSGTFTNVGSVAVNLGGAAAAGNLSVLVQFTYRPTNFSGGAWFSKYEIRDANGNVKFSGISGIPNNSDTVPVTSFGLISGLTATSHTFSLWVRNYGNINGVTDPAGYPAGTYYSGVQYVRMMALGAKR